MSTDYENNIKLAYLGMYKIFKHIQKEYCYR